MRIVAGKWAGVSLTSPGKRVRPTTEEIRTQVMELVEDRLEDARVLDLFSGSGALGLEALSRGARRCDFVEHGAPALHALKANIAKLRVRNSTRIFKRDALVFAAAVEAGAYAVAFADPPYKSTQLDRLVEIWQRTQFASVLIAEHATEHELPGKPKRHRFQETTISVYQSRQ